MLSRNLLTRITAVLLLTASSLSHAQTLREKFDFFVDQAEFIYPEIFPPGPEEV